jgi:hypothetical protein
VAALNAYLHGLISLWLWCFTGTGQVRKVVSAFVVSAVINIMASVALARVFGVVGPLAGTLLSFLAVDFWFLPLRLREVFGVSLRLLGRAVAGPLLLGVVCSMALRWPVGSLPAPGWIGLAAEMGFAALLLLVVGGLVLLSRPERERWRLRLVGVVSGSRP